jgi:cytochrome c oxidase subunit 2
MNFHAATQLGHEVDSLATALTVVSTVLVGLVFAFLLYFSLRYRAGRKTNRKGRAASSWKIESINVFVILVIAIAAFTWSAKLFLRQYAAPPGSLEVYVLGKRWMWTFATEHGPSQINFLEVPRGKPVRLLLTSDDVIHSFFIPEFRIKQDAVPGRYSSLWFQAEELGDFTVLCSEYCGTSHSAMRATIRVVSEEDFERHRRNPAAAQYDGAAVYKRYACASCHETGGKIAPDLTHLYGRSIALERGGYALADENFIRSSLMEPEKDVARGFRPLMPTYRGLLNEGELAALIGYLKGLP